MAYYIGKTLHLNYINERNRASFDFIKLFMDYGVTELRIFIDERIKDIKPGELYDVIVNDHQLLNKITTILSLFEILSVAIQNNYADEFILKKSLNYIAIWIYDSLQPYIHALRERRGRRTFYIEYEKLISAWKQDKSLLNGRELKI